MNSSFNGGDIGLLGSSVYVGGDCGKVTLGLQSMPTDNIAVGWANDDIFDVTLKYADEIAGMKAKLGVGYSHSSDGGSNIGAKDSDPFQIQGGMMDPATGLFGVATYQYEEPDKAVAGSGDETDAYYFKFGIRKQFFNAGDSAFYGEYASYNDQYGSGARISGSELERWGLVAEQYVIKLTAHGSAKGWLQN